jgi:hypothetical protein
LDFAGETVGEKGIAYNVRGQGFECDPIPERSVERSVDLAHTSHPEEGLDLEPAADHIAHLEAGRTGWLLRYLVRQRGRTSRRAVHVVIHDRGDQPLMKLSLANVGEVSARSVAIPTEEE